MKPYEKPLDPISLHALRAGVPPWQRLKAFDFSGFLPSQAV
jgi:hypothetical protein